MAVHNIFRHGDKRRNTGTSESRDGQILRDFIAEHVQLLKLWNVRSKEYTKRDKIQRFGFFETRHLERKKLM